MAKTVNLKEWAERIVENKGKEFFVEKDGNKVLSTNDYTTAEKNKLSGIEAQANKTNVDSSLSTNSENPVQNKVINAALITKVDKETGKGLFSGSYDDLTNKPNIPNNTNQLTNGAGFLTRADIENLGLGGKVTVEQQASPDSGYTATYVIKQDGTQVGTKINIPKDFLVRRATVETSIANNSPQAGFVKGDKYLDFVVNTKDNSGVDEHLYINVNDLFNEYEADESTLTLSADNVFSIKNGVIPQANATANNIKMNGAQSAGTANTWAKADHVHPVDTSRAASSHTHSKLEITDFPSSMTPTSHTHGSITNSGTLNSDINNVNKVVVTDSNQNVKTISKIPYAKIDNTPTIPTKLSELTNDKGYVTSSEVPDNINLTDYVKTNDTRLSDARTPTFHTHVKSDISDFPTLATVATSGSYNDLSNKPTIPSVDSSLSSSSTNPVQNKVINNALAGKAASDHNHDGTYLKSYTPPTASTSQAGIVQLSNTISSTSKTQAATANAVKTAYDKGNHSHPYASSSHNHDGVYLKSYTPPTASTSQAGIVQLNTATNSTSTTQAATPSAVKAAYDLANGKANTSHNQASSTITDSNTYSNIGNTANTLDNILSNINSKLGTLASVELVEVTTNKGTASASTMNKLYLVAESSSATNDSYEIFVTVRTGTSGNYNYAWEKVDTARIDLSNYLTTSNAQSTYLSKTDAASTYQPKGNYLTSHQPIPTGSVSQAGIVQIVDNLTTNDNTKVLSAKQGKALQDNKLDSTTAASTYVAIEDIEDMVGLSYDDTTGILTLTINTN